MKKVYCFGVFDSIHDGHKRMLTEAKALGDYLIIAVTQDQVVEKLKGKKPRLSLAERIAGLKELHLADEVVPGDEDIRVWKTLQTTKPDIVALGYDQAKLKTALESAIKNFDFKPQVLVMQPHRPAELHSSLLSA